LYNNTNSILKKRFFLQQNLAYLAQIKVNNNSVLYVLLLLTSITVFLLCLQERRRLELLAFEEEQAKKMSEEAQLKNTSDINRDKVYSYSSIH
jgi:hypothetical protein